MKRSNKTVYGETGLLNGMLGHYVHRIIPAKDSDIIITLDEKYEHAPDLFALDTYGDAELWWVVPQRNGLQDPVFDFKKDKKLIVPSYDNVKGLL